MFSKTISSERGGPTPWKGGIWGILLDDTMFGKHYWRFRDWSQGCQTWSLGPHCLRVPARPSCVPVIIWAQNLTPCHVETQSIGGMVLIEAEFSQHSSRKTELCFLLNFTQNCSLSQEGTSLIAVALTVFELPGQETRKSLYLWLFHWWWLHWASIWPLYCIPQGSNAWAFAYQKAYCLS